MTMRGCKTGRGKKDETNLIVPCLPKNARILSSLSEIPPTKILHSSGENEGATFAASSLSSSLSSKVPATSSFHTCATSSLVRLTFRFFFFFFSPSASLWSARMSSSSSSSSFSCFFTGFFFVFFFSASSSSVAVFARFFLGLSSVPAFLPFSSAFSSSSASLSASLTRSSSFAFARFLFSAVACLKNCENILSPSLHNTHTLKQSKKKTQIAK